MHSIAWQIQQNYPIRRNIVYVFRLRVYASGTKDTTHTQTYAKRFAPNPTDAAPECTLAVSDHKSCFAMLMRPLVVVAAVVAVANVAVAFLLRNLLRTVLNYCPLACVRDGAKLKRERALERTH